LSARIHCQWATGTSTRIRGHCLSEITKIQRRIILCKVVSWMNALKEKIFDFQWPGSGFPVQASFWKG